MNAEILGPEEATRARRYQMKRLWLGLAASVVGFAVPAGFWIMAPGEWFREAGGSLFWAGAMYFAVLVAVHHIAAFPLDYASEFRLPRSVGLSNESLGGWLKDQGKSLVLNILIGGAVAGALAQIMAWRPYGWWWISAVLGTVFGIFMVLVTPVLIVPLFFRFKRITNSDLVARLENLLVRTGSRVRGGVWEMDMSRRTRAGNAALVGWGPSRRVVLGDTVLDYAPEEIEAILAHEIAHHVGNHIWLLIAGRGVSLTAGLFLAHQLFRFPEVFMSLGAPVPIPGGPSSVGALWIFMTIWGVILAPFYRWISRRLEFWCDRFAASHTGGAEAISSALTRLCKNNLADPSPPAWAVTFFHTHPPLGERIRRVRETS